MNRQWSWSIKAAGALSLVALLGACSSAPPTDSVRGALIVVGSGSQEGEIGVWRDTWVDGNNHAVSVSFSPDGEEVGISALLSGNTYVATSDSPLDRNTAAQSTAVCGSGGAFSVPTSIAPVAVIYNLSGLRGLELDAPALAGIFAGTISSWNDPAIRALNPLLDLPAKAIVPVTSDDESVVTAAGTRYLADNAGSAWAADASATWPDDTAGKRVDHDRDVAKEVDDNFGTIAFLSAGAIGNRFSTAALKFGEEFVTPSRENIDKAIDSSRVTTADYGVTVTIGAAEGTGYQLAAVRYQAFCTQYPNEPIAKLVRSWAEYVVSEPGQSRTWVVLDSYSPNSAALEAAQDLVSGIDYHK